MGNIKRFHPGTYIKDSLDALEMTSKEFSIRTGISERTLSSIINGNGSITFDVAYKLSQYFDTSITYWTNLQTEYYLYLKSEELIEEQKREWELVKTIKKYLIDNKLITSSENKEDIIKEARKLAGVNSLCLLKDKDLFVCLKEQHTKNNKDYFHQNYWIALSLNEARKRNGIPYNKKKLLESLNEIRSLTIEDEKVFYPRLKEILSECGISFVLLPYLKGSNIYGATKWFSKDNVMLAISNRGERADLFWFTLFHEISHVLMEHRRETLISDNLGLDTEADKMAEDILIPRDKWNSFKDLAYYTEEDIERFSKKINILPIIVLGRLHKYRSDVVPYGLYDSYFNVSYHIE
ncbi:MAG: HigA family addiction module antidote protein [Gammaproteobacteria bacterium]|nr:HigA family addiction module antidote protein [Gammaproteobacteria bacterium]